MVTRGPGTAGQLSSRRRTRGRPCSGVWAAFSPSPPPTSSFLPSSCSTEVLWALLAWPGAHGHTVAGSSGSPGVHTVVQRKAVSSLPVAMPVP